MTSPDRSEPAKPSPRRRRAAWSIIAATAILNLAMFTAFLSLSASFELQERVVRGEGALLCQNALAEQAGWDTDPMVGSLRYVDTAEAEGSYSYRPADGDRRTGGTIRCTFDAPTGRDSLRVVDLELLP